MASDAAWTPAIGVRSSCAASATNCRVRDSEASALASAPSSASSISSNAAAVRPSSVSVRSGASRRPRWPRVMPCASLVIRSSGRNAVRVAIVSSSPASTNAPTSSGIRTVRSWLRTSSMPAVSTATVSTDPSDNVRLICCGRRRLAGPPGRAGWRRASGRRAGRRRPGRTRRRRAPGPLPVAGAGGSAADPGGTGMTSGLPTTVPSGSSSEAVTPSPCAAATTSRDCAPSVSAACAWAIRLSSRVGRIGPELGAEQHIGEHPGAGQHQDQHGHRAEQRPAGSATRCAARRGSAFPRGRHSRNTYPRPRTVCSTRSPCASSFRRSALTCTSTRLGS